MSVPAAPDAVRQIPADPVAAALAAAAAASPAVKRAELRAAVRELRDRCLFQASAWAAEQLIGLPAMPSQSNPAAGDSREERGARDGQAGAAKAETHTTGEAAGSKGTARGAEGGAAAIGEVKGREPVEGEEEDSDEVLFARALFDVREFRRAAHVLEGVGGRRALFLRCYALYLAGEKRKEEIILETSSQQQTLPGTNQQQQQPIPFPAHPTSSSPDNPASPVANPELPRVQAELEQERAAGRLDAWGKYLLGVVLAQRGREGEARGLLCESVREYPWNWAAWQQIERGREAEARGVLCETVREYPWNWAAWQQIEALCLDHDTYLSLLPSLPAHWMTLFALSSLLQCPSPTPPSLYPVSPITAPPGPALCLDHDTYLSLLPSLPCHWMTLFALSSLLQCPSPTPPSLYPVSPITAPPGPALCLDHDTYLSLLPSLPAHWMTLFALSSLLQCPSPTPPSLYPVSPITAPPGPALCLDHDTYLSLLPSLPCHWMTLFALSSLLQCPSPTPPSLYPVSPITAPPGPALCLDHDTYLSLLPSLPAHWMTLFALSSLLQCPSPTPPSLYPVSPITAPQGPALCLDHDTYLSLLPSLPCHWMTLFALSSLLQCPSPTPPSLYPVSPITAPPGPVSRSRHLPLPPPLPPCPLDDSLRPLLLQCPPFPIHTPLFQALCLDHDTYLSLLPSLPAHWMTLFALSSLLLSLHRNSEALSLCLHLASPPSSSSSASASSSSFSHSLSHSSQQVEGEQGGRRGIGDGDGGGGGGKDEAFAGRGGGAGGGGGATAAAGGGGAGETTAGGTLGGAGAGGGGGFPHSTWVAAATATAHYNLRDFDSAEAVFTELTSVDPYRLEAMDTFSNILYVKEDFAGLSHLAHRSPTSAGSSASTAATCPHGRCLLPSKVVGALSFPLPPALCSLPSHFFVTAVAYFLPPSPCLTRPPIPSPSSTQVTKIDKYRPETCCIVGNYFSLKGHHTSKPWPTFAGPSALTAATCRRGRCLLPSRVVGVHSFLPPAPCFALPPIPSPPSQVTKIDKYRPETCCIVGNYFSLKGRHERAVAYFRRALRLDRCYLSAWTLMGHEYVEMKNSAGAIQAYRRAVDINPRDYRAWYGLGQTYEILAMPYYALYYYRKAASLRPHDSRMWCAMGQCYEAQQLQQPEAAIRCYRRAVASNESEGLALHKLSKLYEGLGQMRQAAHFYKRNLDRMDSEQVEGPELVEALLFLATHHRSEGSLAEAERYSTRLLDFGGP
ncbi:unnamed protein product, partial [Closterium sp. Naga37s-1]